MATSYYKIAHFIFIICVQPSNYLLCSFQHSKIGPHCSTVSLTLFWTLPKRPHHHIWNIALDSVLETLSTHSESNFAQGSFVMECHLDGSSKLRKITHLIVTSIPEKRPVCTPKPNGFSWHFVPKETRLTTLNPFLNRFIVLLKPCFIWSPLLESCCIDFCPDLNILVAFVFMWYSTPLSTLAASVN